jgi:tripartite-type tricarboxylate transporter receptor subunit TctC
MSDVPTVREAGIASFEVMSWNGFFAPTKTPPDMVARLNREFFTVLQDQELRRRFAEFGLEPLGSTPAWLGERMASEIEKWAHVIADSGIEKQ